MMSSCNLPACFYVVEGYFFVCSDQGDFFNYAGCYQELVKRVFVMKRQLFDLAAMA
jgi:hypothetical protein